jgi:hypothetical protein
MDTVIVHHRRPVYVNLAAVLLAASAGMTVINMAVRLHSHYSASYLVTHAAGVALVLLFVWTILEGKGWTRWAFLRHSHAG